MATYQSAHNILISCNEQEAQYIIYKDKLYRDNWMVPETKQFHPVCCNVIEIDSDEYDTLLSAFEDDEDLQIPYEEPIENESISSIDPIDEITIEFVKEKKIVAMSKICNETIENGFDIVLSDGNTHHFSLTTQDQLNLLTSSVILASSDTEISYHADGEPWQYYSASDMENIISVATLFRKYHLSYFNSLHSYINSLTTISEISDIVYGITIPAEYQNDVLKDLISQIPVKSNV